ncbi:hypothetical protein KPC83_04395 [Collinsella sp. zg1085]|uniref:hypothetical protein n=1 Tax=Collinsella sp. zg1085 TaxID=2844380 RepID=UPI001C0BDD5F|nr:hypothetical protein [Collinsella sp. zg1085]QWT17091.1 hypothetical protein KPC83_04395 [Collinsella sp. zg1085]
MSPIEIALLVLVVAGIWALIELALTLKRSRQVVSDLSNTVEELESSLNEARPMIAKLDGALDDLQPALVQIEPMLKQANIAIEALSADLLEVNGVIRDVSAITGSVSHASNSVAGVADAAVAKVGQLFGKKQESQRVESLPQSEPDAPALEDAEKPLAQAAETPASQQYYTYDTTPASKE